MPSYNEEVETLSCQRVVRVDECSEQKIVFIVSQQDET